MDNRQFTASLFRFNLPIGIAISMFALGAMLYELVKNGLFPVESLLGHLGLGLLFIYFSGKPMADERIQLLKFKSLAISFMASAIVFNLANYLITYPDPNQNNPVSSYTFVLLCMILTYIIFFILLRRE